MAIAGKLAASKVYKKIINSRSLNQEDKNTHLFYEDTSSINLTIPISISEGTEIEIAQLDSGIVQIIPDSGVSLNQNNVSFSLTKGQRVLLSFYSPTNVYLFVIGQAPTINSSLLYPNSLLIDSSSILLIDENSYLSISNN